MVPPNVDGGRGHVEATAVFTRLAWHIKDQTLTAQEPPSLSRSKWRRGLGTQTGSRLDWLTSRRRDVMTAHPDKTVPDQRSSETRPPATRLGRRHDVTLSRPVDVVMSRQRDARSQVLFCFLFSVN